MKVESELKKVQPLIDEAKNSIQGISKSNLDWLKSLRMPPEAIHDVMKAVLKVFGIQDESWSEMKKFLGTFYFLPFFL